MKSKKRRHVSSDESEDSNASDKSSSSSESDTVESTHSEHRYKKKKKRAESSDSDSVSDDQRHTKKRKHKKKKKKHVKKKKRSHSEGESESAEEEHFLSEGEISIKKKRKHKHKHSKRERSLSLSEVESDNARGSRRLHSVVKERRGSSEEVVQPVHSYYQKGYHRSQSVEDYEREREVQRFYRGSSKEHRQQYPEHYQHYERERNDRCLQDAKNLEIYDQNMHYNQSYDDYSSSQRDNDYKRQRYDDRRPQQEEYQGRGKRDDAYNSRPDLKGYNRYNQYEERQAKRREYEDNREQWDRRPAEQERYREREREREYPDKKEEPPRRWRYREEGFSDRPREPRRERPAPKVEKVQPIPHRDYSRSRSPDVHYKERNTQRGFDQAERDERNKDGRQEVRIRNGRPQERDRNTRPSERDRTTRQNERVIEEMIERSDRPRRSQERRPQRERPREGNFKNEPRTRDKKSRFADVDEKKEFEWGKADLKKEGDKPQGDKEKPNFGLSGKLTADVNTVNGVVIKYSEPDDAKQPKRRWRFYPFKGDKALPILYIHRQSAFLIGRDKKVVDIALEHPSVSKQHAALQYRATPFTRPDGSQGRRVRPYIIDLESANGTFVNNKKIEPRRYVELLERDVVKFGFSQREYVLLHENSKDDAQDDDNVDPNEMGAAVTTTDQIKHEKRLKQEVAEDG